VFKFMILLALRVKYIWYIFLSYQIVLF